MSLTPLNYKDKIMKDGVKWNLRGIAHLLYTLHMMNSTIVHHKDTIWSGVWVHAAEKTLEKNLEGVAIERASNNLSIKDAL